MYVQLSFPRGGRGYTRHSEELLNSALFPGGGRSHARHSADLINAIVYHVYTEYVEDTEMVVYNPHQTQTEAPYSRAYPRKLDRHYENWLNQELILIGNRRELADMIEQTNSRYTVCTRDQLEGKQD